MTPADLERLIRRDPAGRGLLADPDAAGLCSGHLGAAAESLAGGTQVGVVTGFFVPDAQPPAAETDGLSGSILLADVLQTLGIDAVLITDAGCAGPLEQAVRSAGCDQLPVLACPLAPEASRTWRSEIGAKYPHLSHLVAVERPGPSYSSEHLRQRVWADDDVIAVHDRLTPAGSRGRCHNIRGRDIHNHTADLHILFEESSNGIRTIGICDGGNEIGGGGIPWPQLRLAIPGENGALVACRTKTDWTILAGVSDWGAFALAAAVCLARGDASPLGGWDTSRIERLLHGAVNEGRAIDGITRRCEPTVDSLPIMTYLQPWLHIRHVLGLDTT